MGQWAIGLNLEFSFAESSQANVFDPSSSLAESN